MNIFYLDKDIYKAARYHCDKHVVKMITETAQILSTAMHINGQAGPYKPTHVHHPCVKWAASSSNNILWLRDFGLGLYDEYRRRYGKQHKAGEVIKSIKITSLEQGANDTYTGSFDSEPPACVDPEDIVTNDIVESYRNCYRRKRNTIDMRWTNTEEPIWLIRS